MTACIKLSRYVLFSVLLSGGLFIAGQAVADSQLKRVAERDNLEQLAAVVEAINIPNRIVTLRSLTRDASITMEVGDEVRNLDQVVVGDQVIVEFYEAIAVDLKKGGGMEPSADVAVGAARAEPGAKPAGAVGGTVQIVATILAIDPDEPSVTLRGPEGNIVDVLVRHPEKLDEVDVGDQVVITYSRAMAIGIRPSPVK
jgi:hypothetical protein